MVLEWQHCGTYENKLVCDFPASRTNVLRVCLSYQSTGVSHIGFESGLRNQLLLSFEIRFKPEMVLEQVRTTLAAYEGAATGKVRLPTFDRPTVLIAQYVD